MDMAKTILAPVLNNFIALGLVNWTVFDQDRIDLPRSVRLNVFVRPEGWRPDLIHDLDRLGIANNGAAKTFFGRFHAVESAGLTTCRLYPAPPESEPKCLLLAIEHIKKVMDVKQL
jgi:hypothetical protein